MARAPCPIQFTQPSTSVHCRAVRASPFDRCSSIHTSSAYLSRVCVLAQGHRFRRWRPVARNADKTALRISAAPTLLMVYDAQMDSNQKQAVVARLLVVSQGSAEDAGATTNGASAVATGVGGHDRVAVSVSASGGTASVTVPFEIA